MKRLLILAVLCGAPPRAGHAVPDPLFERSGDKKGAAEEGVLAVASALKANPIAFHQGAQARMEFPPMPAPQDAITLDERGRIVVPGGKGAEEMKLYKKYAFIGGLVSLPFSLALGGLLLIAAGAMMATESGRNAVYFAKMMGRARSGEPVVVLRSGDYARYLARRSGAIAESAWNSLSLTAFHNTTSQMSVEDIRSAVHQVIAAEKERAIGMRDEFKNPMVSADAFVFLQSLGAQVDTLARSSSGAEEYLSKLTELANSIKGWSNYSSR